MNDEQEWDGLIAGLRNGEPDACRTFWDQYGQTLEIVAQRQLSAKVQRRIGADDVVQSACRTFFRRMSAGQFELPDADALWRLMCSITVTKARRAARDQNRLKRNLNQEQYLDVTNSIGDSQALDIAGRADSPVDVVELADQLEFLLNGLSGDECQVLDLKMQQLTNDEIAVKLNCSERTVRRMLKSIQDKWSKLAED